MRLYRDGRSEMQSKAAGQTGRIMDRQWQKRFVPEMEACRSDMRRIGKKMKRSGKLFWKIYIQAMLGMLLLAAALMGYLLWESQRQGIDRVIRYEAERLDRDYRQFQTKLQSVNGRQLLKNQKEALRRAVAVNAFRTVFLSRGALFEEDQEIYNASEYAYDPEFSPQSAPKQGNLPAGIRISGIERVNGKELLLFSDRGTSQNERYGVIVYKDVTDIYMQTQRVFWRGLCVTAVALLVTGILLYHGICTSLYPLMELMRTAAAIAGGAYESRAAVRGKDEIAELTESFNRMAQKVEEHMALMADTNEKQRRLLGSLAHELKTPLTAIIGYSDTLLAARLTQENRQKALYYIASEGKRLARLAEKMTELSGLYEEDASHIAMHPVAVGDFLKRLKELTQFLAERKKLHLVISCTPKELTVSMDEDLMMSLLMNLTDNACKASPEGGTILVSACMQRIEVQDFGKGIPEEELSHVTQPFYMVNKARAKTAGSVGLGLSLCSEIARLHGASIEIQSEEGVGTRVSIVWSKEET